MRISFTKSQQESEPILINADLEVVDSVKLLGLNISGDLTWNIHINEIVKKASKRSYFLVQLKRAKVILALISTLVVLDQYYGLCSTGVSRPFAYIFNTRTFSTEESKVHYLPRCQLS